MQPIVHSNYGFQLQKEFETSVEMWIDSFEALPSFAENKIFIAMEPNEIDGLNQYIKKAQKSFNHILTYDEELLTAIPHATLFEYGTTWIDFKEYKFPEKKFNISFVCGDKDFTKGHILRQKIWFRQMKINTPVNFFISSRRSPTNSHPVPAINNNQILFESKYPLFDSMFHICIENVNKKNYFSEKIIDAFLTKTIPIYWGCPNISNYFNMDGICVFDELKDAIDICNSLTEEDYYKKRSAIEENYQKALRWISWPDRLYDKLIELEVK